MPAVIGLLRPAILLPAALATGITPSQLEAILAHELAHIRRYDPFVHLLQRIVEAILFFHPAVWFVSRSVSDEREYACDELVLSAGWQPLDYADAMLSAAEFCSGISPARFVGSADAMSLAASGHQPSQFKRRMLRLMNQRREPELTFDRGTLLAVGFVLTSFALGAAMIAGSPGLFAASARGNRKVRIAS